MRGLRSVVGLEGRSFVPLTSSSLRRPLDRNTSWVVPRSAGAGLAVAPMVEFASAEPGRFIDNNSSFLQEFPVRGYEVSPNQRASMVTIANLLQVGGAGACRLCMTLPHSVASRIPREG